MSTNCEKFFIATRKVFRKHPDFDFQKRENESRGLILDLDEWNE